MNTTSPRSSLAKLGLYSKPKPFKVMVLGQSGVGKSALVVRFITRRYIGEYDPSLEKVYAFHTVMDNEVMDFEILDSAGEPHDSDCMNLETHIRWAEAFILMYSVTDKCSFDECNRLKFLINYNKRRRRLGTSSGKDSILDVPVVLVGNKTDLWGDRMVSTEDGHRRSKEIGCVCFHEISVRESIEQVWGVFRDVCSFWRVHNKSARLRHGLSGGGGAGGSTDRDLTFGSHEVYDPASDHALGRRWTEVDLEEVENDDESSASTSTSDGGGGGGGGVSPFRGRASTDGHLAPRPQRWRHPPPPAARPPPRPPQRRMSISMRGAGDNATY